MSDTGLEDGSVDYYAACPPKCCVAYKLCRFDSTKVLLAKGLQAGGKGLFTLVNGL